MFPLNHSSVASAGCLGSCWKVNLCPSLKSLEDWNRFPSRISLYLAAFLQLWPVSQSLPMKTSPQHDAATIMLHCGDGVLGVMRGVVFAPDIAFSLMAKKLNCSLIWTEYLLPYVWVVTHICLLANTKRVCLYIFFKQLLFSGHSSVKLSSYECTA